MMGQSKAEKDLGSWFLFFNQHQFSEHWNTLTEVQHRSYAFGTRFNQLLMRTTLNYKFSNAVSVGAGYGLIPTDNTYEIIEDESLTYVPLGRLLKTFVLVCSDGSKSDLRTFVA